MKSGVYRIVNIASQTTYIGSSCDVRRRLKSHKMLLLAGRHSNSRLQRSWNKYGADKFAFEELVHCERSTLAIREQEFIDAYVENDLSVFNQRQSAHSGTGFTWIPSAEFRARRREIMLGNQLTKGMKYSRETIERMTAKRRTIEARARASETTKKQMQNPEMRGYLRKLRTGSKHSLESRLKMSESRKGNKNSLGRKHSEETKAKMAQSHKGNKCALGYHHTDETKARVGASLKQWWANKRLADLQSKTQQGGQSENSIREN